MLFVEFGCMIGIKDPELSRKFGQAVRLRREKANISTRDFANEADISHSQLYYLEKGEGNPSLSMISAIAKALKITLSELLEGL